MYSNAQPAGSEYFLPPLQFEEQQAARRELIPQELQQQEQQQQSHDNGRDAPDPELGLASDNLARRSTFGNFLDYHFASPIAEGHGLDDEATLRGSSGSAEGFREKEKENDGAGNGNNIITWTSPTDPQNPLNWAPARKWAGTFLVSCFTFISPLASTMVAPALDTIAEDFDIESKFMRMFVMAIFLLGYAVGPFIIGPLSEVFGRVKVLQAANLWFLVFNGMCGWAGTTEEMLAYRFLAGMGGSAPQAVGQGILADIWRKEERGLGSAIYGLMTWLGPAVGPIAGAFCTRFTTWRWVFWATSLFSIAIQLLAVLFLRESYGPYLLRKKAKKLRKESGDKSIRTEYDENSFGGMMSKALVRPFIMLFTQPIIIAISTYRAFFYGVMYLVLATFPEVWEETYNEETHIASLNYISLLIGFLVGLIVTGRMQDKLYAYLKSLYKVSEGKPEYRIPPMLLGGILAPAGLLMYGWSAQYHTHWIVPNVGSVIFAAGLIVVFQCCQNYLIDAYTTHAASAAGAAAFLRTMCGFSFPLFADKLYDVFELGWGNTLLAGVSFGIGVPAAWALWVWGERIRGRSRYCAG